MGVLAAGGTAAGAAIQGCEHRRKDGHRAGAGLQDRQEWQIALLRVVRGHGAGECAASRRRGDGAERDVRGRDRGDVRDQDHRALICTRRSTTPSRTRADASRATHQRRLAAAPHRDRAHRVRVGGRLFGGADRREDAGHRRVQAADHLDRRRHRRRVFGEPCVGATDRVDDASRVRVHDRDARRAAHRLGIRRRHRDEHVGLAHDCRAPPWTTGGAGQTHRRADAGARAESEPRHARNR